MTKFTKETAVEYQRRSAKKRKENRERRAIIREMLYEELNKPASSGSSDTLGLHFVRKALQGAIDNVKLEDLERIQRILGENNINLNITKDDPAEKLSELLGSSYDKI